MQKLVLIFFLFFLQQAFSQVKAQSIKDSSKVTRLKKDSAINGNQKIDTTNQKEAFSPRKATIRSAIIPGWGQIYNKKYWKLPLVYGALGTTAGIFFYNIKTYRALRLAFLYKSDTDTSNDVNIPAQYQKYSASALRVARNGFRQNIDYSVLFFILFWGLNVVDATVDAQLKAFDVNDNISLKLHPGRSSFSNTTGISLVFDIHSKKSRETK